MTDLRERIAAALENRTEAGADWIDLADEAMQIIQRDARTAVRTDRPGLQFRLEQIVGVKDAARSLPALIERQEPVVLTRRGEPKAVLLPLAEYERVWLNEQGMNGVAPEGPHDLRRCGSARCSSRSAWA